MIFNDDSSSTFEHRISETVDYLKYCQHRARKLSRDERRQLLRLCLQGRILRMPDNNNKVIQALLHRLSPQRNFTYDDSATENQSSHNNNTNNNLAYTIETTDGNDAELSLRDESGSDTIVAEMKSASAQAEDARYRASIDKLTDLFFGAHPRPDDTEANSQSSLDSTAIHHANAKKIEDIISALQLLSENIEDSGYRLIDVIPQLGDVFEIREELVKQLLQETIDKMFEITDVDRFHAVKLNPSLDTPVKRKAFLFDLVTQNFQRLRKQHNNGVYLDDALENYRQKLKRHGINA